MKKFLLLSALSVACASSPNYERGAYPVRPPPVARPSSSTMSPTGARDAPHDFGQPGHVGGRGINRSPNKRYAEPSAQPQMMAADGDARRTVELMLSEAVPEVTPEGIERADFAKCWKDTLKMMNGEKDQILAFSPQEVRCLRHRVLAHCGARKNEKRFAAKGTEYEPTYEDFMASDAHKKACGRRGEFRTERTIPVGNRFMDHGDTELNWRP